MDQATFRTLVSALEAEARRDPSALRRRVYGVVALGYAYVLGILALVLGGALTLLGFMIASKSIMPWKFLAALLVLAGLIARALWVRVTPPTGLPVPRSSAPILYGRVEEIRAALKAPRPNAILLTEEFNASVSQVPRLGIFGAPVTYLTLGLPLMYALTPAQFDAVLGHEFGHLSGSHPKRGLWVYRVSRTWDQLMTQMEQTGSWASRIFQRFFRWYIPRLNAYGFVMARQDEYAADADGARITSASDMGAALVASAAHAPVFGRDVWARIFARADHEPTVPERAWRTVPDQLRAAHEEPAHRTRIEQALQARAGDLDTHPSLHDRLRALALLPDDAARVPAAAAELVGALERSAAAHYLGDLATERLAALDADWRNAVEGDWHKRYRQAQVNRRRLAELADLERDGGSLATDDLLEVMRLTADLDGRQAAEPTARRLVTMDDRCAEAHFLLGVVLLERKDEAGVAHVERAMALDPAAVIAGLEHLYWFHEGRGDEAAMADMKRRLDAQHRIHTEADAERSAIAKEDRFARADVPEEIIDALQLAIRQVEGVTSVLLARKLTRHFTEQPLLVIVLQRPRLARFFGDPRDGMAQEFLDRLDAAMPDRLVIPDHSDNAWLAKRLRAEGVAIEISP
jgi:Zn-dependent protease with chaperone function